MVIATHEMGFAREVADFVAFLHEGTIVEHGPPEEVLVAPERPETQALPQPPARGRPRLRRFPQPARRGVGCGSWPRSCAGSPSTPSVGGRRPLDGRFGGRRRSDHGERDRRRLDHRQGHKDGSLTPPISAAADDRGAGMPAGPEREGPGQRRGRQPELQGVALLQDGREMAARARAQCRARKERQGAKAPKGAGPAGGRRATRARGRCGRSGHTGQCGRARRSGGLGHRTSREIARGDRRETPKEAAESPARMGRCSAAATCSSWPGRQSEQRANGACAATRSTQDSWLVRAVNDAARR